MSKPLDLLLILLASLLATNVAGQPPTQPTYLKAGCQDIYGNHTTNSTYHLSLRTLLSELEDQSSQFFFSNTSAGSGGNTVYGQYYCRGDIDASLCSDCIKQAAETLASNCSNFNAAVVWYDVCTLHYQNRSTVGIWGSLPRHYRWSTTNVSDPATFSATLESTMDALIRKAGSGDGEGFATGEGVVSAFETVYCMVQCSPDLNGTQCDLCLRSTFNNIERCCGEWPMTARVLYVSCQLRYSMVGAFYSASPPPPTLLAPPAPPPTLLAPPPPPPLGKVPSTGTKETNSSTPSPGGSGERGSSWSTMLVLKVTGFALFLMLVNL